MATTTLKDVQRMSFMLELPKSEATLLKSLAKKLGWTLKNTTQKKSAYEQSQEDIRAGRVETFASADEMFQSLGI